jgi:hypothetical protein
VGNELNVGLDLSFSNVNEYRERREDNRAKFYVG